MASFRLVLLTAVVVVLMAMLTSSAKSSRWPKPPRTKQPPRAGNSGGGGGGRYRRTTTTTPHPSHRLHTEETTEAMMDGYSLSPTDSTTYSNEGYTAEFHTDALVPHGPNQGNYTLDYSGCLFNFCECCPPEKGPVGPAAEPGPPGERGLPGLSLSLKMKIAIFLQSRSWSKCVPFLSRVARCEW